MPVPTKTLKIPKALHLEVKLAAAALDQSVVTFVMRALSYELSKSKRRK